MARLILDSATKSFGKAVAVDGVSLTVEDGEFLAVLGPSGCGKTTLLRLIAGFETLTDGSIQVGDRMVSSASSHVAPEDRRMGVVFQSYALWPHMNVAENVGYALTIQRIPAEDRRKRVAAALETVDLSGFATQKPALLSGGQRQRVALARCLAMEPALVLLDEPLANLDVHLRAAMQDEFAAFHKRAGKTMVYITHDQAEAMALADRIAVMDEGRLLQVATPSELYRQPANARIARFIGEGMVIDAEATGTPSSGRVKVRMLGITAQLRCSFLPRAGERLQVCIRAADVSIAPENDHNLIRCRISRLTYLGGHFRAEVIPDALPETIIRIDLPEPCPFNAGDPITIRINDGWVLPT
jgi:iron(III) transport system ATP-binding protein